MSRQFRSRGWHVGSPSDNGAPGQSGWLAGGVFTYPGGARRRDHCPARPSIPQSNFIFLAVLRGRFESTLKLRKKLLNIEGLYVIQLVFVISEFETCPQQVDNLPVAVDGDFLHRLSPNSRA